VATKICEADKQTNKTSPHYYFLKSKKLSPSPQGEGEEKVFYQNISG